MIVGISGYIGSGKDTVALAIQYLVNKKELGFNHCDDSEGFPIWLEKHYDAFPTNGWTIKKFAGKLKQVVSLLTGIPVSDLEKQSVKDSFLGSEWNYQAPLVSQLGTVMGYAEAKMTVRTLLQKLGTDAMRDKVHPNIHVNALFSPAEYRVNIDLDFLSMSIEKAVELGLII